MGDGGNFESLMSALVKSGHGDNAAGCPLFPPKQTLRFGCSGARGRQPLAPRSVDSSVDENVLRLR
jgi:hypothetical protein